MSFELILPFLRPIEHLIRNDADLGNHGERLGVASLSRSTANSLPMPDVVMPEKSLQVAVRNIARMLGDEINDDMPLLDARLPDGSRVAAAIPPCSSRGTTLTIRKFQSRLFTARRTGTGGNTVPE